jgi:ApaG protein
MANPHFKIDVAVQYLAHESSPQENLWGFAYTVTVTNTGDVAAQLIARHWVIDDSFGHRQEVRGLGVVGKQPYLQPGESFQYTSGTRIQSPMGSMHGTYFCITEDAQPFEATISAFALKAEGEETERMLH